jgi:NADPH-dependent 2,4-dienoyl-CoA reductase/sulfur reductase-like enzyme
MVRRLVVVGGDAAGMSAAGQARRRLGPDELEIVAFERGRATSYSACGIPYWIGGVVEREEQLVARSPEQHRRNAIDVRMRTEVVAIDLDAHTVHARDLDDGREYHERYDDLVYATGSVPVRPPIPGIDASRVFGVQTLDDGAALRAALEDEVRRVVIIGAGYIGLEVAEACQARGLDTSVVDQAATPMATVDPDMGELIADAVRDLGVTLVLSDGAAEIETGPHGEAVAVRTKSGRRLPADVVVLGLGVRPNVAVAEKAGIPLGTSGGIAVDHRMRTQADHVWAAGDCVESVHRLSGQRVVIALGTHANKQGRVAGINLAGGYATFPGVIGTGVTKVCEVEVARTGLSEAEASAAGYCVVTAAVDSTTRAGYFPGAEPIRLKLLAEKGSGRLLGAQIVGRKDAAKRIDVLATAIWNEMDVHEILHLDLSYAPPFSPVWDPVLIAARKAADAVVADRRG